MAEIGLALRIVGIDLTLPPSLLVGAKRSLIEVGEMSLVGTKRTCRLDLTMSVDWGRPEVAFRGRQDRF
jgi:hypothetical protein